MENIRDLLPFLKDAGILHLKYHSRHISVNPEEILFCKAEGSYTKVVIEGNFSDILVSKPLKLFQRCIPLEMFLRCHYSYLINIKKVQSFDSKKKIIAFEECFIPISRRKANNIFSILSDLGIHDVRNSSQI
jgi:two-component system LytT family response regulator